VIEDRLCRRSRRITRCGRKDSITRDGVHVIRERRRCGNVRTRQGPDERGTQSVAERGCVGQGSVTVGVAVVTYCCCGTSVVVGASASLSSVRSSRCASGSERIVDRRWYACIESPKKEMWDVGNAGG